MLDIDSMRWKYELSQPFGHHWKRSGEYAQVKGFFLC